MSARTNAPAALAAAALTAAALVAASPAAGQQDVRRSMAIGPDPYVRVMVFAGSVTVTGWDADTIGVSGAVRGDGRFYLAGGGKGAKLGVWPEGESASPAADLAVRVPRGSTVWVKTESASVRVADVTGSVDVYTVTGDVRIEGTPRGVYAESMGGAIEILASASTVRAKTAAGPVTFRGRAAELALATVAGEIRTETPPLQRGRFETVTGDIRFAGGVRQGGSLDFRTHSGGVELLLPPETEADFLVRTIEGRIRMEGAIEAQGSGSGASFRGKELGLLTGEGGASVAVQTYSGDVVLRASGPDGR